MHTQYQNEPETNEIKNNFNQTQPIDHFKNLKASKSLKYTLPDEHNRENINSRMDLQNQTKINHNRNKINYSNGILKNTVNILSLKYIS